MKACSNNVAICAGVVVAVLLLLLAEANVSVAVTCDLKQLRVCIGAISPNPNPHPTPACCSKLKEQEPCLCQYLKDPIIGHIISSPDAKKVAKACGVAIPKCHS